MQNSPLIKAILSDIDGVWTDGKIIYDHNGTESKAFHVRDGLIISPLRKMGFVVGIITGRQSAIVQKRADELGLDFCQQGISNKAQSYDFFKEKFDLQDHQIAYIGDDLNDLPIINKCGVSACPADAPIYIQQKVHFLCKKSGGQGAFREFVDAILQEQKRMDELILAFEQGETNFRKTQ